MRIGFGGIGKGYAANRAKLIMGTMEGVVGGLINGWLEIENMSVVTSGDYEKYFKCNDVRYAHIINPKTGLPSTGIKSVTVICPDAEIGDALATSIFILGKEEGIRLVNTLKNIEALIITDQDEMLTSKRLELKRY